MRTKREINKSIAAFMGVTICGNFIARDIKYSSNGEIYDFGGKLEEVYTHSLDSQIQVWGKLKMVPVFYPYPDGGFECCMMDYKGNIYKESTSFGEDIALAAAKATCFMVDKLSN